MTGSTSEGAARLLDDPGDVRAFLRGHGLFDPTEPIAISFLSGGVSSLVMRAEGRGRCAVLKQALPQLKVRDLWLSRVERSEIEARCAAVLARLAPGSVPAPLATDAVRHVFVMACAPAGSVPWKTQLMAGTAEPALAASVGALLGRIHAASAAEPELARAFDDRSFFEELRVSPYLRTTAERHPDLAEPIGAIVAELVATRRCLVHGDFSPKNLLVAPNGRVLLVDHEVAHWGNPTFDAAFVLNHLCLKALKFPDRASAYLAQARDLWQHYQGAWAGADEAETARLLGALMLARVDGKSPAEYLETEAERDRVRQLARSLVAGPVGLLDQVLARVEAARA